MTGKAKTALWMAAVCLFLAGLATDARPQAASPSQTWTGILVDATCYFDNPGDTGNVHEGMINCGMACLQIGRPAGILMPDRKFTILIAPSPDIAKYAGENIRVTGKNNGSMILVQRFEVKQGANWTPVRLSSIM